MAAPEDAGFGATGGLIAAFGRLAIPE